VTHTGSSPPTNGICRWLDDARSLSRGQAAALRYREHRPYAPPAAPWVHGQSWLNLLFAHWPVRPERLEARLPPGARLETYDGSGWVSLAAFAVGGTRLRGLPPVPVASRFNEINVRTYASVGEASGVLFLSLDATSAAAVLAGRVVYRLPYAPARIALRRRAGGWEVRGRRIAPARPRAELHATYGPTGDVAPARPGSLEHWLVERYRLVAPAAGLRAEIHHRAWPLQPAWADIGGTMLSSHGIVPDGDPVLHYCERQDVVLWLPAPAG
jgi:uncharacterized protein YqjF (DUF2071 family)